MPVCPRCGVSGSPYKYTIKPNGKTYLYYVHRLSNGKRRICYIGPTTGYSLVAKMYNLEMQHAFDVRHRLQVFVSLLDFFLNLCEENGGDDVCREFKARLKSAKEVVGEDGSLL